MAKPVQKIKNEFSLIQLLPNLMTVTAICAGLTAIRFGIQERYETAVLLIVVAGILDGFDGWLARRLNVDSQMGAELDSLADFLNFGVAPPLLIYFWALQDMASGGWIAALVFSVCCVLRLARFNAAKKSDTEDTRFFTGVPSPAGALLVMLPMFLSFSISSKPVLPSALVAAYMICVGFLLISRIPTPSIKSVKVSRENVKFFLVAFAFVGAALLTYPWVTLVVFCLAYAATVGWGLFAKQKPID